MGAGRLSRHVLDIQVIGWGSFDRVLLCKFVHRVVLDAVDPHGAHVGRLAEGSLVCKRSSANSV